MKNSTKVTAVKIIRQADSCADLSFLDQFENAPKGSEERKYYKADQKRKADYGNGWEMVGIRVVIAVVLPSGTVQTFKSGGLWGIDSDSDESYFNEVALEEYVALRADLEALNIDAAQLDTLWAEALDRATEYAC